MSLQLIFLCICALASISHGSFPLVYPQPSAESSNATSLYLAVMMSFNGTFLSSGTIPGIQIALDLINEQEDLLPGYKLHYIALDSRVNSNIKFNYNDNNSPFIATSVTTPVLWIPYLNNSSQIHKEWE